MDWSRLAPVSRPLAPAAASRSSRGVMVTIVLSGTGRAGWSACSLGWVDGAGAAVDGHHLAVGQAGGGIPGGDHGGDAVLAGDQGGVGRQGPAVGDDRGGVGEQRRPGGGGGPGDQDLAGLEAVEVTRSVDDADRAGGPAGAGWLPDDGVLWRWAGGAHGVHGAEELLGEQPGWAADGQGGQQAPLPLPGATALVDELLQGGVGVEFGAGQEEHVLGPVDHAVRAQGLAQAQRAAAQQRPAEGELAGLLLPEDRIPLGDLEQRPEPRLQRRLVAKHGQALGGEGLAAGGQLAVSVLGWLGWWPAEFAGGGVGPVEALDGVGGQLGLAAGQPDQQLLDASIDRG